MDQYLPANAIVDKFIAKTKFYQKTFISSKLKNEFTDKIKKITWKYKLAEDTLGISKTENVTEIQIFEIELKEQLIPKTVLKVIDKAIPYPILYRFLFKDNVAFGITLKGAILKNIAGTEKLNQGYYFSEWNEVLEFDFTSTDLEKIYQKLIKLFIRDEVKSDKNFEAVIKTDNQIKSLEKEITLLSNKVFKEKQFNKKVELNKSLLDKKQQLKSLIKN
jgi:hypothetical protein